MSLPGPANAGSATVTRTNLELLGAAAIGLSVCLVVLKGHGACVRRIRSAWAYCRNPLRHQSVQICSTFDECRAAVAKLNAACAEYRVLGFDCEWVTVNGSRRPVALLQLAAHNGFCALIRLRVLSGGTQALPVELRELLASESIVKVGVVPMDDARNLCLDYGLNVTSTLDLRHMARARGMQPLGLARMAKEHLDVTMDKDWRISCSDWEARTLTARQIDYAAKDALVAVELFRHFAGHRRLCVALLKPDLRETLSECEQWLDVHFRLKALTSAKTEGKWKHEPRRNAQSKRAMSTRATPLYENCFLQAPDGQLLCTCDRRKAEWYVQKDIGVVVTEQPLTVRLKFEPAGRAVGAVGQFYQQEKSNRCVVCGCSESYQRKNVVPREYRKSFPTIMKDHTSHDVLLLCPTCHQRSNSSDLTMRQRLARMADAPIAGVDGALPAFVENPQLKQLKSAAKALYLNAEKIPADRVRELESTIRAHYPNVTEISNELLKEVSEMNTQQSNPDYNAHGEMVVAYFQKNPEHGGLIALERMWRQHFLDVMKPRFLPDLWSVEHSVEKLEIRYAENRITDEEIHLSGLKLNAAA